MTARKDAYGKRSVRPVDQVNKEIVPLSIQSRNIAQKWILYITVNSFEAFNKYYFEKLQ